MFGLGRGKQEVARVENPPKVELEHLSKEEEVERVDELVGDVESTKTIDPCAYKESINELREIRDDADPEDSGFTQRMRDNDFAGLTPNQAGAVLERLGEKSDGVV